MKPIRAGAVQFHHSPGDKQANLEGMWRLVRQARGQSVALLAFPEMCITGYWHLRRLDRRGMEALAEEVPDGPSSRALLAAAAQAGMTIGAGLLERAAGRLYNSYLVAMPDGAWACHRKLHPFVSEHLDAGDRYTVFDTPQGCRVGVLVCYDNNLGENVRITALAGAEVLLAPHQTGGCRSRSPRGMRPIDPRLWHERHEHPEALRRECQGPKGRGWLRRWLPARAHDNGLFVVFSNGIGLDDDEVRTGNAMVLDPYGEVLAESAAVDDDLAVADLDPALRQDCTGQRWLTVRRPELYGPLCAPTGRERPTRQVRLGPDGAA